MSKDKRKTLLVIGVILVILVVILIYVFRFKKYEISYKVDEYTVVEKYDDVTNFYSFEIKEDGQKYNMVIENDSLNKKRLISGVSILDEEEEKCIFLESKKFDAYPVCYKDDELVDYDLIENKNDEFYKRDSVDKINIEYESINIKEGTQNYFIWNYRGYYFINSTEQRKIEFLEEDHYQNALSYKCGKYLLTPNYDQEYNFTEMYVIDMKTGKFDKWNMEEEISYNSYFLGDYDGEVYLVDSKNKKEYKLNPRKKKIERIDKDGTGLTYERGWEKVSINKLASDTYVFKKEDQIRYLLEDGTLKSEMPNGKFRTTLSKRNVDKIIYSDNKTVYYLVKDEIYSFSKTLGENLVLKYSELNFNNRNYVFMY